MAITNPEAVRFVNEQVRTLCEEARAFAARVSALSTAWFAGVNTAFPNDSTALDDGRDAEGVSRLTGAQVNSAVGQLLAGAAAMNSEIISKPCVRPLEAS